MTSQSPGRSRRPQRARSNRRSIWPAACFSWRSRRSAFIGGFNLPFGHAVGHRLGPDAAGSVAILVGAFGVLLVLQSLRPRRRPARALAARGPVFVLGAVLLFAMVIRGSTLNFGGFWAFRSLRSSGFRRSASSSPARSASSSPRSPTRTRGLVEVVIFAVVMTAAVRPAVQGAAQPADPLRSRRPHPESSTTPMSARSAASRTSSSHQEPVLRAARVRSRRQSGARPRASRSRSRTSACASSAA